MKKIMKTVKYVILPAILLCLFFTGCGIKGETREEIIRCLTRNGYIGKEDSREYERRGMGDGLFPQIIYYDYIYSDEEGEMYNVRIYPSDSEEEEKYDIEIFYDVEIEESVVKSGDNEYTHIAMSDYASERELEIERRSWLIFNWLAVVED